jgi:simple sugar transport system permease protein
LIAILCVASIYLIMMKTPMGYEFRTIGANPRAARYGGIDVTKNTLTVFLLSGGLAGLAGVMEIIGVNLRLMDGISSNYGYLGVVVALLGRLHPVGVFLAALFLGFLIFGIQSAQRSVGLPVAFVIAFEGIVIICLLLGEYIQKKIERSGESELHGQQ